MSAHQTTRFHSLTFVGVGPGDPSLLTLAAVQSIKAATIIAFPISAEENDVGIAESIASKWITKRQIKVPLLLPMTSEENTLRKAWEVGAKKLVDYVEQGEKVVYLCQGDVSLFASSSYMLLRIKTSHAHCPIKLIPGVTSISAGAALGSWPLALQNDQLLIVATPEDSKKLEQLLDEAAISGRVLALMKLGHRWSWVRPLLEKRGLLAQALFAERVGFTDEKVTSAINIKATQRSYFSFVLIRQAWPSIIP